MKKALLATALVLVTLLSVYSPLAEVMWVTLPRLSLPGAMVGKPRQAQPLYPQPGTDTLEVKTAEGDHCTLDISHADQGYVLASCTSNRKARVVIERQGEKQTSYLSGNGSQVAYPLSMGNGPYTVRLYLHKVQARYNLMLEVELFVQLENETLPYLVPNYMVPYTPGGKVEAYALQFGSRYASDMELATEAFEWVSREIKYQDSLLDNYDGSAVADGESYIPDLSRILEERTGVCADYASLFAAFLRVNGVPCQILNGYVEVGGRRRYHAWNRVWLPGNNGEYVWRHFDPTFFYSTDEGIRRLCGIPENTDQVYARADRLL